VLLSLHLLATSRRTSRRGRDPCLQVGDALSEIAPRWAGVTPVYWLETRLPAPFRYRYVSCLSSVRRLLCSKGYLGRPVAIVWDMWRVLPALSHVTRLTRLSRERTVRTAVQRLGRRWPILLPGGGYGCMFVVSSRSREGSNCSPINTLQRPARPRAHTNSGIRQIGARRIASGPYRMGGYALPRGYAKRAAHPLRAPAVRA